MEAFLSGSGLFNPIIQFEGFLLSELMSDVQMDDILPISTRGSIIYLPVSINIYLAYEHKTKNPGC